jgi:hypothetical protein
MVSPAVPSPVMTGVVTLVMSSPGVPLSLPGAKASAVGAADAVVSMVRSSALDATETFPAASVLVAVSTLLPAASVAVVIDQVPVPLTSPVPTSVAPS